MRRARTLLLVLLPLALTACVSFPQSAAELRATNAGVLDFTANASLHAAYALVSTNTIRCHQGDTDQMSMVGSSYVVFPTGQTRVEGVVDARGATASVTVRYFNPAASGLLQVVDFEAKGDSKTRVLVYRLNDTNKWKTATEAVRNWFDGSSECYELW